MVARGGVGGRALRGGSAAALGAAAAPVGPDPAGREASGLLGPWVVLPLGDPTGPSEGTDPCTHAYEHEPKIAHTVRPRSFCLVPEGNNLARLGPFSPDHPSDQTGKP